MSEAPSPVGEPRPMDELLHELELQTRNEKLTQLTSIARALFGALDGRSLVDAAVRGVNVLTGGHARFYRAMPDGRFGATLDLLSATEQPVKDAFLAQAAGSALTMSDARGRRIGASLQGASVESRYVMDVRLGSGQVASSVDQFAIGALAQYVAVAVRNVELYRELEARRAAVAELNQLKTDLIAMLAHDFRSPLTSICGFAELVADTEPVSEEAKGYLLTIASSALRLARLASDTLALAHLEQDDLALRLAAVDLAALVPAVAEDLGADREIEIVIQDEPLMTRADPGRLTQVFENLIGNALKYSPGGEPVRVTLRRSAGEVEVAITDRGIGIAISEQTNVFSRYARGSNARQRGIPGTGFGLFLAKTIVDQHGGRITLESREGQGSTFYVYLPGASAAPAATLGRALVLDPAGTTRSLVAHVLRSGGYAVRVVSTGEAAIVALNEQRFDVAILDTGVLPAGFFDALADDVRRRAAFVACGNFSGLVPPEWDAAVGKLFLVRDLEAALERALAAARNRDDGGELVSPA